MSDTIDPRIKNLSYSSMLTLHACPRRFQLYKLGTDPSVAEDISSSITFAYGSMVGTGIQDILEGKTEDQALLAAALAWPIDLFAENPKQNKSFFSAWVAVRKFAAMKAAGSLKGYELVYYNGKPANELSFSIELPDGFIYRGFVDAVLQHVTSREVMVLECKTTASANVNPAQYKNSAQAIGYSIVLDAIFPRLSSYKVLYLVYQAKSEEYVQLPFSKSYYQRALWIQELLLDVEIIKMYDGVGIYPMRGESCFTFFRECEYYLNCTLSTKHLIKPLTPEMSEKIESDRNDFHIRISLADLLASQEAKNADVPETAAGYESGHEIHTEDEIL